MSSIPPKWMLSSPWVIRELGTNRYFIQRKSKSNSHYYPVDLAWPSPSIKRRNPLFFRDEAHCKKFIAQWRRGTMHSDEDGTIHVHPEPQRKDVEFEYLQVHIVLEPTT